MNNESLEVAAEKYALEYVKEKFADIYSMPAKIAFTAVKKDFISGAEWCNEQYEFIKIEYTTEKQTEIISEFMEHYKAQTGKAIPENIFLSFFNA